MIPVAESESPESSRWSFRPFESRIRLFAMVDLHAYSDESETPSRMFCVAGFVAPLSEWERLDAPWTKALRQFSLAEFKMADCVQGQGQFLNRKLYDRLRAQSRFLDLLSSVRVEAFAAAIDLNAYNEVASTIEELRALGFEKPYYLAFQQQVEAIANGCSHYPPGEQVGFFFDEQKEYQGKAKELYDSVKRSTNLDFIGRLGTIAFVDSAKYPGIQAADLFAYETKRHIAEVLEAKGRPRKQWMKLRHGRSIHVQYFNGPSIRHGCGSGQQRVHASGTCGQGPFRVKPKRSFGQVLF